MCRHTTDFCILSLHVVPLSNALISSSSFLVDSIETITWSPNKLHSSTQISKGDCVLDPYLSISFCWHYDVTEWFPDADCWQMLFWILSIILFWCYGLSEKKWIPRPSSWLHAWAMNQLYKSIWFSDPDGSGSCPCHCLLMALRLYFDRGTQIGVFHTIRFSCEGFFILFFILENVGPIK